MTAATAQVATVGWEMQAGTLLRASAMRLLMAAATAAVASAAAAAASLRQRFFWASGPLAQLLAGPPGRIVVVGLPPLFPEPELPPPWFSLRCCWLYSSSS